MIDIDNFKKVNDTYGHQSGDIVLFEFSSVLKSMIREYDTLGRFGGEEFLILLPQTNSTLAKITIQRMLEKIAKYSINVTDNHVAHITFSAGLCEVDESMSLNDVIEQADKKMYEAKRDGKNRVY